MNLQTCLSGLQKRALKHSSDKSKVQRNKMKTAGEKIEYRCLIRATDGKKTISTIFAWHMLTKYELTSHVTTDEEPEGKLLDKIFYT
ncbi:UNVERIFIED_CONTAM: Signal recognition particle protein [Sesamum radiatum]|uniref:Signal recognition particle 14 kDa protein n=1 Tax=Sesamum radiatum TaxID=300843 RepID=A0AAW2UAE0_SESRA